MNILVLSGTNHGFDKSAAVIADFLGKQPDIHVTLDADKAILTSPRMDEFDACVFGTGFTRSARQADGTVTREADLTPDQEAALLRFVESGKGSVGAPWI